MSYQEILELMKEKDKPEFTNEILVSTLLKFHPLILSGISLVGMIYYFAYFGFELKYFPDLGGADVAYVGVSFFFISAFISLSIILPCLCYPGYYKKDIGWMFYFILSLFLLQMMVCMAVLNITSPNVYSFLVSLFYLLIIVCIDKKTTSDPLYYFIASIISAIVLYAMFIFSINPELFIVDCNSKSDYWITMITFFVIPPFCCKSLEYFYKRKDYVVFVMTVSIIIIAILSWFLLDIIANRLGMTNVEYKYLSIEKNILGVLPFQIYSKDKEPDKSNTYYEIESRSKIVKLHNIKALSTLGKFYYLETKDKVRFELDASKIISREKQER